MTAGVPEKHGDGLTHCPHWTECGGCQWQDRAYAQELRDKRANLEERLAGLWAGASPARTRMEEIIPSPDIWYFRNKMEFVFGGGPDGEIRLGLHPRGAYGKVVNVTECLLQSKTSNVILEAMRRFATEAGLTPYTGKTHAGFLRHLVIREGKNTGDRLVHLITTPGEFPAEAWGEAMRAAAPDITGLMWSVNGRLSDTALPEETRWTWGRPEVRETVGGVTFRISPTAFFQTNTRQAERLYKEVAAAVEANVNGGRPANPDGRATVRETTAEPVTVLDVCAGTGGVGLTLAKKHSGWRVIGVEISPEAVRDANANAAENGLGNCEFVTGDAGTVLREMAAGKRADLNGSQATRVGPYAANEPGTAQTSAYEVRRQAPDNLVVALDPPRGGLAKATLLSVIRLFPRTLIYIACNPAHLAADGRLLQQAGYRCRSLQPVDMFPHTPHVEVVAAFTR